MGDRVALVTGGSRGIGRATCVALGQRGFPVAISYRNRPDAAKETRMLVEQAGGEGMVVEADVTDIASIESMFERVEDSLGPIGVLINNAGLRKDALGVRMTDDTWDDVLATNLSGAFTCSRRALRTMIREGWGRIVNVASVAGVRGSIGQSNYSAAKAGLIGLTRTMAREVARKNITVNAIAPGLIDTDLTATLSDDQRQALLAAIPMGRAGTTAEIGGLIAFLCSEEAAYVTGAVLVADGGMTA